MVRIRHSSFRIPSCFVIRSNLRFPAFPVFPSPQLVRFLVAPDFAGRRVDVERVTGAPSDVAEMTPERALDPFFNLRVGFSALTNAVDEVCEVAGVVSPAFDRGNLLAIDVVNLAPIAGHHEVAFVSVKTDPKTVAFEPARMTAMALPSCGFIGEIVSRDVNVRRFLVVVVLIPSTPAGYAKWVIDPESPTC